MAHIITVPVWIKNSAPFFPQLRARSSVLELELESLSRNRETFFMSFQAITVSLWLLLTSLYLKGSENLSLEMTWQLGVLVFALFGFAMALRKNKISLAAHKSYTRVWIRTFIWSLLSWGFLLSSVPALIPSLHTYHYFYFLSLLFALHLVFLSQEQQMGFNTSPWLRMLTSFSLIAPALFLQICIRISSLNPLFKISASTIETLSALVFIYSLGVLLILNLSKPRPGFDLKNWVRGFLVSYFGFLIYFLTNNG